MPYTATLIDRHILWHHSDVQADASLFAVPAKTYKKNVHKQLMIIRARSCAERTGKLREVP